MLGLSLVVASRGHSSSRCAGLSLSWPLLLRSTGSRRAGSVIVAHGLSCSVACGIFPDQGSNPCPLHWQADSQPLHHQGSPAHCLLTSKVSDENSAHNLIEDPLYVMSHFSFATFKSLSVSVTFESFIIMCLEVSLFEFILLGACSAS